MTRSDLRLYATRALIVILVTVAIIAVIGRAVRSEKDKSEQAIRSKTLSSVLVASRYDRVDLSSYSSHSTIQAFYIARDESGKRIGFVMDVLISDSDGDIYARMSFSSDGEHIKRFCILNEDGTEISNIDAETLAFCNQFQDIRIPVALISQMSLKVQTQNEHPSIKGLHDGVFYAEAEDYDRNDYLDYVEIRVMDGRIIAVNWDAVHRNEGELSRSEASIAGAFSLGEDQAIWAAQAFAIRNKLLEVQDPSRLAIKSDGTTEIVDDVQMDVHLFYNLVVECIEHSKNNRAKPPIYAVEKNKTEPIDAVQRDPEEEVDVFEEEIVQSEHFQPENEESIPLETFQKEGVIGHEDGVVDSGNNPVLSDSIDGLPLSEIRTQVDELSGNPSRSILAVRSINHAYKFLREYLKWGT